MAIWMQRFETNVILSQKLFVPTNASQQLPFRKPSSPLTRSQSRNTLNLLSSAMSTWELSVTSQVRSLTLRTGQGGSLHLGTWYSSRTRITFGDRKKEATVIVMLLCLRDPFGKCYRPSLPNFHSVGPLGVCRSNLIGSVCAFLSIFATFYRPTTTSCYGLRSTQWRTDLVILGTW